MYNLFAFEKKQKEELEKQQKEEKERVNSMKKSKTKFKPSENQLESLKENYEKRIKKFIFDVK